MHYSLKIYYQKMRFHNFFLTAVLSPPSYISANHLPLLSKQTQQVLPVGKTKIQLACFCQQINNNAYIIHYSFIHALWAIRSQVNSRDTSPSRRCLNNLCPDFVATVSLRLTYDVLACLRTGCTLPAIRLGMADVMWSVALSPKQPPNPALMTYFPLMSMSRVRHIQMWAVKCVPNHLSKWFECSDHNSSQWLLTLEFRSVHL